MSNKPSVMLVHGAWADGSCWSKVILLLQAQGYTVTAAQLPLMSLDEDIEVTGRLLAGQPDPTVLVGHSYGGAVITGAATATPQVRALVYITAFGLDEGESLELLASQGPPSSGSAAIEPDTRGFLWLNREKFHLSFAEDVTADEAAIMAAVQKPLALPAFSGRESSPAWKQLPSWYLQCSEDKMIPPTAQKFMAKRMNATVLTTRSSHCPFISQPQAVADIIVLAAESL